MAEYLLEFTLKSGANLEKYSVDSAHFSFLFLRNKAVDFINKHCTNHGLGNDLWDHILFYRHDLKSVSVLEPLTAADQVNNGAVIEVVITESPLSRRLIVHPHSLLVHNFHSPTFCDFCGELLIGLFKQGLQCEVCGLNCHKRCALKVPNNCSGKSRQGKSPSAVALDASIMQTSPLGPALFTSTPQQQMLETPPPSSPLRSTRSSAVLASDVPLL